MSSNKKQHWEKPEKKEEPKPKEAVSAATSSSWTPPWKNVNQVTNYILKNRENQDFLKKAAAHFGVEYSSDFDALAAAIFDKAQYRL